MPCETGINPTVMRARDTYQKLKMKSHAESKRSFRDSDIQVGDIVLVKKAWKALDTIPSSSIDSHKQEPQHVNS